MSQDFYSSGYGAPQDQYNINYGYNPGQAGQDQQYGAPQQPEYNQQQPEYNQQPEYAPQQDYGVQQNDFYNPGAQYAAQEPYAATPQYSNQSLDQTNTSNDFYSGSFYNPASPSTPGGVSMGSMGTPGGQMGGGNTTSTEFEDDPPLMEELGIDIQQIY